MLLPTLLALTANAAPPQGPPACERAFFERVFPEGRPHRPPPLRPILELGWDVDDSGHLDETERAALRKDHELRCEALERVADDLDADGDGTISTREREEGLRALFGPKPPPPPRDGRPPAGELPPPVLFAYDTDRDGTLSPTERSAARADIQDRFRNGLPPVAPPSEVR